MSETSEWDGTEPEALVGAFAHTMAKGDPSLHESDRKLRPSDRRPPVHRGEPNATGQRLSATHSFDLTDEDVAEATDAIEAARVQHYDRNEAGTRRYYLCESEKLARSLQLPDVTDEVAALRAEVERVNLLALDARKEAARDRERAERAEAEVDHGCVREIRVHCAIEWTDLLRVRPIGGGWEFVMIEDGELASNSVHLDDERLRAFAFALLRAVDR